MTRILGAVFAGGRSRRFGSDKAVALFDGTTLIDHAIAALADQCDTVVVSGRAVAGCICVADRPAPDLGPLGGLNAALHHAVAHGYDAVVSVPCDMPILPADLVARLQAAGSTSFVTAMPVVGLWPARLADELDLHLAEGGDRSMWRWTARVAALPVTIDGLANVNTPDDLARLKR
ncbi:molybdenum cofactor guanylyltransferase [uncultured Sphingomonas sp.]|uniref:molybdenum cofactor guanylyltransferase n=1 Tax=uncultured Sphingomonas sp. TaxID=158754 RepID=UPI0035CA426A